MPESNIKVDVDDSTMSAILLVPFLMSIPVSIVFNGFAVLKLWQWFIVPQFGLAPMRLVYAIGLACVFRAVNGVRLPKKDDTPAWKTFTAAMVYSVLIPSLILFEGWVVHLFA